MLVVMSLGKQNTEKTRAFPHESFYIVPPPSIHVRIIRFILPLFPSLPLSCITDDSSCWLANQPGATQQRATKMLGIGIRNEKRWSGQADFLSD